MSHMHAHTCACVHTYTVIETQAGEGGTGMAFTQRENNPPPCSPYILCLLGISAPAAISQRPDSRTNG